MIEFDIFYKNSRLRVCCDTDMEQLIKEHFYNHAYISQPYGEPTYTLVISKKLTNPVGEYHRMIDKWFNNATLDCYIDNENRVCYATNFAAEKQKHEDLLIRYFVANLFNRLLVLDGYLGIHASCVEKEGKGVLFVAERNSGKTICMLNLMDHGYNLVTNDVIALKKETSLLSGYGIAQDVSIRLSPEFCIQEKNQKYIDLAKIKGIDVSEKGLHDGQILHLSDSELVDLNKVKLSIDSPISFIVRPCYNPFIDHLVFNEIGKDQLRELIYSQYRSLVHETTDCLNNAIIPGINEKDRYSQFDSIVSIPAYYCQQNENTTKEFVDTIEKIRRKG